MGTVFGGKENVLANTRVYRQPNSSFTFVFSRHPKSNANGISEAEDEITETRDFRNAKFPEMHTH
uniref:Expressed protein n=1 Tax=Echinococcus granulosus TaxID=6210 RepID=A0A068WH49_ECHGR|nr:expressed protein [Echinococcus granulosus]